MLGASTPSSSSRPHGLTVFIIPAIIITLREIWMSVYRARAARTGSQIPASRLAKWKTFVQDWAIGFTVLPFTAHHPAFGFVTIWLAAVMTVYTGWQYYYSTARRSSRVRVEIVAVGTELLLGQIPDTNSQWLGERLAANGISSHFHQHVGDNHERIVLAFRTALARSDAIIVCGGLGPTQDDITRAALAEVMNVPLDRARTIVETIRAMFQSRGRAMPDNNLLQADVPRGATIIPQTRGTAPGLICQVGQKVVYAVPGVPYEMTDMFDRAILPDLLERERASR